MPPFMSASAGAVERLVVDPALVLERMVGGKHGVHVPGQQQPPRGLGADPQDQMPAVLPARLRGRRRSTAVTGAGSTSSTSPGSAAKASASSAGLRRQPGEVARCRC